MKPWKISYVLRCFIFVSFVLSFINSVNHRGLFESQVENEINVFLCTKSTIYHKTINK